MPDTTALMRQKLKDCDLLTLFIEELGWNHHRAAQIIVESEGVNYVLNAIAEKHGMVAYECESGTKGQIPDYLTRGRIEKQVKKSAHEHIIVFVNGDKTSQTWQWVRREKDRPTTRREHTYVCTQPGDSLIQKLQSLMISLEEEEMLTIVEVTGKVRQAFDIDRITKRFYERFEKEHKAFLNFIEGITVVADREWYASLMLNRLMFIYFIQKRGFLDSNNDYLRNRLQMVRLSQGKGKFHTFYRYFLRRLFHEGLAQRKEDRKEELNTLLGNVPYLNGGLFDTHQLENDNPEIQIPDEGFERLFDFFDAYQWHLDERPTRADNEINPDVLGYIFEKYINQKQMGAYYTKEDITEYISKSTIVPFIFNAAEKKCAIAFRPEGAVWRLLRDDPDRYIYDAVKKGVDLPLPEDISVGVADVSKRGDWNHPAGEEYALPTESWREHVARRTRCLELRAMLAAGEIHSINDLITYNLDLRQFAQDVIENCEGPDLLRAFYKSIEEVSILDPTCGSGAFLFAALNILEPLYEACLERMEVFVTELDKPEETHHPEKFSDFRKVLEQAHDRTKHPSRQYFVLKSIVLGNIYGIDIMAEAVEICKLRLFLKLVAQVERVEDVEPLPDIDFNIRVGNTLVGFTSLETVSQAMTITIKGQRRLPSPEDQAALKRIDESAELAGKAFSRFREQQTGYGMQANQYLATKSDLLERLAALRTELDRYLATEYGVNLGKRDDFEKWRSSHQPFHWFVEFYGVMHEGGFDVIIGNPPFVEYSKVSNTYTVKGYKTISCGNLYPLVVERSLDIGRRGCHWGLIMQLSSVATKNMKTLQSFMRETCNELYISCFAERPQQLFVGACIPLAIALGKKGSSTSMPRDIFTGGVYRWHENERDTLFERVEYCKHSSTIDTSLPYIPKIRSYLELSIYQKFFKLKPIQNHKTITLNKNCIYFRTAGGRYWKVVTNFPSEYDSTANKVSAFDLMLPALAVVSMLSSNLFWWYYISAFDLYKLKDYMIFDFRYDPATATPENLKQLSQLGQELLTDYRKNSNEKTVFIKSKSKYSTYREYLPRLSKSIIDKIDGVLAKYYGFTEEELDFIINYDIKYRMGKDFVGEDD